MFDNYVRAYRDSYHWLYRVCPPWRWALSAGLIPGSPAALALRSLRAPAGRAAAVHDYIDP